MFELAEERAQELLNGLEVVATQRAAQVFVEAIEPLQNRIGPKGTRVPRQRSIYTV